jgi:hypothetical protein
MPDYNKQVFLNVPFDNRYRKLLHALVFVVHDCGLEARCALESEDGGQVRLEKIYGIIESCRYGIHDLSRTALDSKNRLPRFNMPLELGVFLGLRRFGGPRQRRKSCLILDKKPYRYQIFCSDIAGQDIRIHGNQVDQAIRVVRNWLRANLPSSVMVKSPSTFIDRYIDFRRQLPGALRYEEFTLPDLTFFDYRTFVDVWIEDNP